VSTKYRIGIHRTSTHLIVSSSSFPGTPNGHIAKCELPTLPKDLIYACQKKAWFDDVIMTKWIDEVLAPDVATAPPGIVPIPGAADHSSSVRGTAGFPRACTYSRLFA
jgi:hypothetical protein